MKSIKGGQVSCEECGGQEGDAGSYLGEHTLGLPTLPIWVFKHCGRLPVLRRCLVPLLILQSKLRDIILNKGSSKKLQKP